MMSDIKGSLLNDAETHQHKEWDEITCPICMEHPHNAVLLICSSHDKGCRSYICDTSYRHSNCLDRFQKMREASPQASSSANNNFDEQLTGQRTSETLESFIRGPMMRRNLVETLEDYNLDENSEEIAASLLEALEENNHNQNQQPEADNTGAGGGPSHEITSEETTSKSSWLKCPLCRGNIMGWMIVKEARRYWDMRQRSCSRESCSFSGNYQDLRRHARQVHPTTRPADVDPTRQRTWRRLEHQQEYGDILSAISSAMPGAVVLGDYVLDTSIELNERGSSAPFWSTFVLFHMMSSSFRPLDESRPSSRGLRRRRSSPVRHRNLWGENLLGLAYDDDDDDDNGNDVEDEGEENIEFLNPRRRRRITRSSRTGDNL